MNGDPSNSVTQDQKAPQTRGRSTIEFPYLDQDEAVSVAVAVHAVGGTSCTWDQLAAQMKQASKGGSFRMKLMTARNFGLLEYDRGNVTLSDLGIRIIDPKHARAARAESFLAVPLYKATFEKLKGGMLPPPAAIERSMETLGVAPKQKDKARQVFMRSAKSAGYFDIDPNRLTEPPKTNSAAPHNDPHDRNPPPRNTGGGTPPGDMHPFIRGLVDKLPEPESNWPIQARIKWLQAAANIFDLIYSSDGDVETTISINSVRQN